MGATLKPKLKNLENSSGFLGALLSMSHQGAHRSQPQAYGGSELLRLLGVALTGAGVVLACTALVAVPSVRSPEKVRWNLEGTPACRGSRLTTPRFQVIIVGRGSARTRLHRRSCGAPHNSLKMAFLSEYPL